MSSWLLTSQSTSSLLRRAFSFYATLTQLDAGGGSGFKERGAIADEYIQAIVELWTQESPSFQGKYVSFDDVAFEPKPIQKPHLPVWFGGDADAVLRRTARYGSGWWPQLAPWDKVGERLDFIRSQPDYNGRLTEVFYGIAADRVGEGHVAQQSTSGDVNMPKEQILDMLGKFAEQGVTMSAVPIPPVRDLEEYVDYMTWVAEEILPAVR